MVRTSGGTATLDAPTDTEDIEDLTASEGYGPEDDDDLDDDDDGEVKPRRKKSPKRTLTAEDTQLVYDGLRKGSSVANAAREAGVSWDLVSRYLQLGGFAESDSRLAKAARVLPPEEPYWTFARGAEVAWNEGDALRQAKGGTTRRAGAKGYKPKDFNPDAAESIIAQIGGGATLNTAARQAGVTVHVVIGWLRAGAYPMLVPGGKRIKPENAQEPFRQFALDFAAAESAAEEGVAA
jgi:hypothetical protein